MMRDSFARTDVVRKLVSTKESCAWCGRKRPSGKLFHYGVLADGINTKPNWLRGFFCSVDCMKSFHDVD